MRFFRIALLVALFAVETSFAHAAGLASNENFIVLTPAKPSQEAGRRYAQQLLQNAEQFRSDFAKEWLGEELEAGVGRVIVSVNFSNIQNSGLTWAKDHPNRRFHNIYLTTSPEKALGCTLRHELAHAVLATRYPDPNRLPPWLEEGIASRYDDSSLIAVRQQVVLTWVRWGKAPHLIGILEATNIQSFDDDSYAAAESLVSYLLTRGDTATLLRCAESAQQLGWDSALQSHYRIDGVRQLQSDWEDWMVAIHN